LKALKVDEESPLELKGAAKRDCGCYEYVTNLNVSGTEGTRISCTEQTLGYVMCVKLSLKVRVWGEKQVTDLNKKSVDI